MKTPAKIAKIIGSPGCGKTTYLLSLIEKACEKYKPEYIGAVSYTKTAVQEMRDRIFKYTAAPIEAVKNIRTIHSHCFKLLEVKKEQIADASIKHIRKFNEKNPQWRLPLSGLELTEDDSPPGLSFDYTPIENRKRFAEMQILRNRLIPVEDWKNKQTIAIYKAWINFLEENDLLDYTMLLEKTLMIGRYPEIDVLMVDEAQDLSALELELLKMWSEITTNTTYVGDSNQAIFRFSGATPEVFMNLENQWFKNLEQSYRVTEDVHKYALGILNQTKNKEFFNYYPTKKKGKVLYSITPDLSLPGEHMVIARCNYQLTRWKDELLRSGYLWYNPYRPKDRGLNPIENRSFKAVQAYLKIKNNQEITSKELELLIDKTIAKDNLQRGVKAAFKNKTMKIPGATDIDYEWIKSLGFFTDNFFNMKIPVFNKLALSGNLKKIVTYLDDNYILNPRKAVLGTIHSVKGGEADNVWVDTSTSKMCLQEMQRSTEAYDDEIRIAYVAVTRSKNTLGLLQSAGYKNYIFR